MKSNNMNITTTMQNGPAPDAPPAAERASHAAARGAKPRSRTVDTTFIELVVFLARERGMTAEAIVMMTLAGLASIADEASRLLIAAYVSKHFERMQRTGRAFPSRRGKGTLTAPQLRLTVKRHLESRGLTLESIGWPAARRRGTRGPTKKAPVTVESSLAEVQQALNALVPAFPTAEVAPEAPAADEITII